MGLTAGTVCCLLLLPAAVLIPAAEASSATLLCDSSEPAAAITIDDVRRISLPAEFHVAEGSFTAAKSECSYDPDLQNDPLGLLCPFYYNLVRNSSQLPSAQVHLNCRCQRIVAEDGIVPAGRCVQRSRRLTVLERRREPNWQQRCPNGTLAFVGFETHILVNSSCEFHMAPP